MKKWISVVLPFVGLGIFAWIVRGTGVDRILDIFREINPWHLAIFPLFTVFTIWVRGYRWWVLMRLVGIDYSRWRASTVWAIGFFAASVTPGKVGDAVRAFYLSRDTKRGFGECFLTIFVDRLLDLLTILVFGVITVLIFSYKYIDIPSFWVIIVAAVALLGFVYLVLNRTLMRRLMGPVFKFLTPAKYREQLSKQVDGFYGSLSLYRKHWGSTLFALFLTLLFWGVVLVLAYTITRVLGIDVPFGYIVLIMPTLTLVELIPISVSGIGTRDAAVVFFFSVLGIGSAEAVSFSLIYLIFGTYFNALVGFVAWLANPAKLRQ